ncbi:MAG: aldehyde dehydrogenase family protein [Intrasporangium sp.]|uniref:aldehyde dehydrogenase family protein n=1 Tax=Intrasporangium sp. TaxID=1925024 RepID=UPI003F806389
MSTVVAGASSRDAGAVRPEWDRDAALVGGQWVRPGGRTVTEVENPATETVIGHAADCGVAEADAAIHAAGAAFPGWSALAPTARVAILEGLASALESRYDLLVQTTIAEVGAPLSVAREAHVDTGLAVLRGYLDAARELAWEEHVGNSLVVREGIGVAACITPWNYPFYQVLAKVGGALVAGATVVLKPAELTPLSAYLLADAVVEAGLPPGVFNLVPGRGRVVGEALAAHPLVDMVSFTGSTRVGSRVSAVASETVKRVGLELGGKSASVVLEGADLDSAVRATVDACMLNSGQTCTAWSRLLVHRSDLDRAVAIARERAQGLALGDPTRPETEIGPVASAAQRHTVIGFIERALAAGATLVTGGADRPAGLPVGHYVRPTVLAGAAPDAEIVREEVFGPVLVLEAYDTDDEALAMANGTHYGLAGAVWGPDRAGAVAFARRMRTGQVDVNGGAFNPVAPFGGYRRSGNGRELGRWGIEEFLETKAIQL